MKIPEPSSSTGRTVSLLIVGLPFLLLFWTLPFLSPWTVGRDYTLYPIQHQMELLFSIAKGTFPLFVPGFSGGQSSSALTLGQLYHPLPHVASWMPGYWQGLALEWNTFFRLLLLGLTHLALFRLLHRWGTKASWAFLLSLATVYNLRMLDLFRYGASLESWTGSLLLCTAVGWHYDQPHRVIPRLSIAAAAYFLLCSGHPQMAYFGFLEVFCFTALVPFLVPLLQGKEDVSRQRRLRFWGETTAWTAVGILLAAAYLFPFYGDFIVGNAGRVGRSYAWADSYRDTFAGTVNNFFLPLRSDVHGAFGGSTLFLAAALMPVLALFRYRVPRVVWVIWAAAVLAFLHMQGVRTPVHHALWSALPFASSFRIAGRISMVLPLLLTLILSWTMKADRDHYATGGSSRSAPFVVLGLSALAAQATHLLLLRDFSTDITTFSALAIREFSPAVEIAGVALGVLLIAALVTGRIVPRAERSMALLACACALGQIGVHLSFGTWIEEKSPSPTLAMMTAQKKQDLAYRHPPGEGLYSGAVWKQVSNSVLEPYLGKVYRSYHTASSQEEVYRMMAGGKTPDEIIVEGADPDLPPPVVGGDGPMESARIDLVFNTFNRFDFSIASPRPAFVGVNLPYTGHWQVELNGRKERVYRANGAAHAIHVPAGESSASFRYQSRWAWWGILLSCGTVTLAGSFTVLRLTQGSLSRSSPLVALLCVSPAFVFFLWHRSLYGGENLASRYTWTEQEPGGRFNLAYCRRTGSSSVANSFYPIRFHSGRAVDGDRRIGTGFLTGLEDEPWWILDMARPEEILEVVVHAPPESEELNIRPLRLGASSDGRRWRDLGPLEEEEEGGNLLTLTLGRPHQSRYLLVKASGRSRLAIDEIEVYGPAAPHSDVSRGDTLNPQEKTLRAVQ